MKFSIRAEFWDTKLLVFTLPKASRANTGELINAKIIRGSRMGGGGVGITANTTILGLLTANSKKIRFKAAGDKLLVNKFIRQNFGRGLTLKNVIS